MIGEPLINVAARVIVGFASLAGGAADAAAAAGGVPGGDIVVVDNSTGDGLRIEWDVEKVRGASVDQCRITIWNLGIALRKALSVAMALQLPIEAHLLIGWGGFPELAFSGDVWKLVPERHVNGTDVLTVIDAGAGAAALRDTPPAGGEAVGIAIQLVVAEILQNARLTPSPSALAVVAAAAAKVPMSQFMGYTSDRGTVELLDECLSSIGLSWGIDNGQFVVYQGGVRNDLPPSILTPATGLLTWEECDGGGVEFEALAQARVTPGLQVQILDFVGIPVGGGPLRIERVAFAGSTDGPSTMRGLARKAVALG